VLAEVAAGRPQFVLIEGPPGVGKSALVDQFLAASPSVRVLRAVGDEAERLVSYGAVEQLARSAGPIGTGIVDRLGVPTDQIDDHVAVARRVLEMLGPLQGQAPVVMVLDDVQCMDLPSSRAVVFAERRLVADQLMIVATVRDSAVPDLPESLTRLAGQDPNTIMRLPGLSEQDLSDVAVAIGMDRPSRSAIRRLLAGTLGNLLYARAVLEEFPVADWERPNQALPSPRLFRQVVLGRYSSCSDPARRLVDAAAVLGLPHTLSTVARLSGVEEAPSPRPPRSPGPPTPSAGARTAPCWATSSTGPGSSAASSGRASTWKASAPWSSGTAASDPTSPPRLPKQGLWPRPVRPEHRRLYPARRPDRPALPADRGQHRLGRSRRLRPRGQRHP
jgi:hypothetical protein